MDWNSLTTQQVALFAAAAIVISALVAGTATLVSTIVSGWNPDDSPDRLHRASTD